MVRPTTLKKAASRATAMFSLGAPAKQQSWVPDSKRAAQISMAKRSMGVVAGDRRLRFRWRNKPRRETAGARGLKELEGNLQQGVLWVISAKNVAFCTNNKKNIGCRRSSTPPSQPKVVSFFNLPLFKRYCEKAKWTNCPGLTILQ